jgi:hypothetical protein
MQSREQNAMDGKCFQNECKLGAKSRQGFPAHSVVQPSRWLAYSADNDRIPSRPASLKDGHQKSLAAVPAGHPYDRAPDGKSFAVLLGRGGTAESGQKPMLRSGGLCSVNLIRFSGIPES